MNFKRTVAVVLCGAFALGIAGCGKSKGARSGIEGLLEDYVDALQELDEDEVLELTVWDEDDDEYDYVKECFIADGNATYIWQVFEATASTISIDYERSDIEVNNDKASLKVEYRLVDWEKLFNKAFNSSDDLVKAIKKSDDEITISGKLEFELVDGEWKISKITKLDDVLDFTDEWPTLNGTEWPTIPTMDYQDPYDPYDMYDPNDSNGYDSTMPVSGEEMYALAIENYLFIMETYEDRIKAVEEDYNIKTCGFYDIDNSGVPELFFINGIRPAVFADFELQSCVGDGSFSNITIPNIIFQAGSGGLYNMYSTGEEFIITYARGDESLFTYFSNVYQCSGDDYWVTVAWYKCEVRYEEDDGGNGEYTYEYYCDDEKISEEEYYAVFTDYAGRAEIVLAGNYEPSDNAADHALNGKPRYTLMSYDEMYAFLESER